MSVTEQKISANEIRALKALHNADAGLVRTIERVKNAAFRTAQATGYFNPNTAGCLNGGTVIPNPANTTVPANICAPSTAATDIYSDSIPAGAGAGSVDSFGATIMNAIPFNYDELVIESVGCTDACPCNAGGVGKRKDCPIQKTVRESVVFVHPSTIADLLPSPMPTINIAGVDTVPNPPTLNVLNDTALSGAVNITSSNSVFAMLTGGTITFTDASPTFTSSRGTESPTNTATAPAAPSFNLGVNQVVVNSATPFGTANDFLLRFLGRNFAANQANQAANVLNTIKQLATGISCNPTCNNGQLTIATSKSQVVYVEGTLVLSGLGPSTWGNPNPLLLIVNGDLQIQGPTTINGMVYVIPPATAATANTLTVPTAVGGSLTVNGRLVVEGSLASTGGLTINSNAAIETALGQITLTERIPGTWEEL